MTWTQIIRPYPMLPVAGTILFSLCATVRQSWVVVTLSQALTNEASNFSPRDHDEKNLGQLYQQHSSRAWNVQYRKTDAMSLWNQQLHSMVCRHSRTYWIPLLMRSWRAFPRNIPNLIYEISYQSFTCYIHVEMRFTFSITWIWI